MTTYEHGTLGWWMDERRGELGLTWNDVAERTGVSPETIYRVAKGRQRGPMRTTTKRGIERALNWAPGSIDTIATGGEPTPVNDTQQEGEAPSPYSELRELTDQLDAQIRTAQAQSEAIRRRLDALDQPSDRRRAQ